MESMHGSFGSDAFKELSRNFHKSADEFGAIIEKGNSQDSLAALSKTMAYCVACPAQFSNKLISLAEKRFLTYSLLH